MLKTSLHVTPSKCMPKIASYSFKFHNSLSTEFTLYFGNEIQGLFKDFQGPWSCIFKDQFLTKFTAWTVSQQYLISISVIYGTVLVDKNKTWQLLAILFWANYPSNKVADIVQFDLVFKDFQWPVEWNWWTFKHLSCFHVLSRPWI